MTGAREEEGVTMEDEREREEREEVSEEGTRGEREGEGVVSTSVLALPAPEPSQLVA